MTATLRERAEHAARYGANLVVPATEVKTLLDEADEYDQVLSRTNEILTGVANALNGPPPPLTTWSHHDLAEKAAALDAHLEQTHAALARVRELHPTTGDCNTCTRGRLYPVPAPCPTAEAAALAEGGAQR